MKIFNTQATENLPDGILFDTDNTLFDYAPAHETALKAVCKKVTSHLSISQSEFLEAFDVARKQIKKQLGNTASSHSRLLYMQRTMELLGLGSQILLSLELEQTYWRTFLRTAKLFDDVPEFLDEIRLLGIPMVIVTDLTAQIQFRKIVYFQLDRYFDLVVTSEEAGQDKPSAAPFELALEKMRCSGDRIWMIGDSSVNDIGGARRHLKGATFQKIHSGVKIGTGDEQPDVAFGTYHEMRKLVNSLSVDRSNE